MNKKDKIFTAVLLGHYGLVKKAIIENKFDVNTPSSCSGQTMLHMACSELQIPLIEFLIEQGANTSIKDKYGCTPLRVLLAYMSIDKDQKRKEDYIYALVLVVNNTQACDNNPDICDAIYTLGTKANLSDSEYKLLHKLSYYNDSRIKLAVIQAIMNKNNIPKYIIERVLELRYCKDIEHEVNLFLTKNKVVIPKEYFQKNQSYCVQTWNYITGMIN